MNNNLIAGINRGILSPAISYPLHIYLGAIAIVADQHDIFVIGEVGEITG